MSVIKYSLCVSYVDRSKSQDKYTGKYNILENIYIHTRA